MSSPSYEVPIVGGGVRHKLIRGWEGLYDVNRLDGNSILGPFQVHPESCMLFEHGKVLTREVFTAAPAQ